MLGFPIFFINFLPLFVFFKTLVLKYKKLVFDKFIANENLNNESLVVFIYIQLSTIYIFTNIIIFLKNHSFFSWSHHFFINNLNLLFITFIFFLSLYILYIYINMFFQILNLMKDYYFVTLFLIFNTTYLFIVNNFFSFLFVLEYLNILILYKLLLSKINKTRIYFINSTKLIFSTKKFISLLFYQF